MRTVPVLLTVAITAMVALPVGAASWSSSGGFEPDNNLDNRAFMWPDAPGAALKRVYFNGFAADGGVFVGQGVNPNIAAFETRNPITGNEMYLALLGNWADCNGDGYIGLAESALREYPSELLPNTNICQAFSGREQDHIGRHNVNGWVTELLPIGGSSLNGDGSAETNDDNRDRRVIRDTQAAIWGDYGRPSDAGPESGGGTCPVSFPRGTFKDSGGALNYVDCFFGTTALVNRAFADEITLLPATAPGPITIPLLGDPLGLRASDVNDSRSGGMGQISTFGEDDSNNAAVTVTDCNSAPFLHVGDVANTTPVGPELNGSIQDITIWSPRPGVSNTQNPTVAGQYNQTSEETELASGGCDTSNDAGQDFYGGIFGESNFAGTSVTNKRQAQFNMQYSDSNRGDAPYSFVNVASQGRGSAIHNNFAGVVYDWSSTSILLGQTPNTPGVRSGLNTTNPESSNPGVNDAAAYYISFYAFVGTSTTGKGYLLPGGGATAKYGADQCGTFTSGTHNGWECNAALWNMNADGVTPIPHEEGGNAYPGKPYNLRDVDCMDGSNNLGVPTAPAALGANRCVAFS